MPSAPTPARRLAAVALALAPALAAPAARAGGPPAASRPSGLGWVSGATAGGFPCLADLRGRPLDASHTYLTDTTFDGMVKQRARAGCSARRERAPLLGGLDGAAAVG